MAWSVGRTAITLTTGTYQSIALTDLCCPALPWGRFMVALLIDFRCPSAGFGCGMCGGREQILIPSLSPSPRSPCGAPDLRHDALPGRITNLPVCSTRAPRKEADRVPGVCPAAEPSMQSVFRSDAPPRALLSESGCAGCVLYLPSFRRTASGTPHCRPARAMAFLAAVAGAQFALCRP